MKIAIPVQDGRLCPHFGHCTEFALFDASPETGAVARQETVAAPPHEPGLLPRWLAGKGVQLVIAGGMGERARDLLARQQITVVAGAPAEPPETLVRAYFAGTLETRDGACDHHHHH